MVSYEWTRSFDNSDGPFSFPQNQMDLRPEWARSAGIAPHRISAAGYFKLPSAFFLTVTESWRGSAPFNITTGLDPANDGLYTDRGGRARNSGNGPGYQNLTAYLSRRIALPKIEGRAAGYINIGIQGDNLLGNRNYLSIGSIVGSPTFGQPLAATPGRSLHVSVNFN